LERRVKELSQLRSAIVKILVDASTLIEKD
jgi:hypothetical protein